MQPVILLDHKVVETATASMRTAGVNEAGGVLLGFRRGPHLHGTIATVPASRDRATPTRFHRQDPRHQEIALEAWRRSNGYVDWIGEWHSHPGGSSIPSRVDLETWTQQVGRVGTPMMFLIVSSRQMGVFLMRPREKLPAQLQELDRASEGIIFGYSSSATEYLSSP
tara:strand:- start:350 stop:850 length:501 start_codon:yes stop_codon:yes gene_type:complete